MGLVFIFVAFILGFFSGLIWGVMIAKSYKDEK